MQQLLHITCEINGQVTNIAKVYLDWTYDIGNETLRFRKLKARNDEFPLIPSRKLNFYLRKKNYF